MVGLRLDNPWLLLLLIPAIVMLVRAFYLRLPALRISWLEPFLIGLSDRNCVV